MLYNQKGNISLSFIRQLMNMFYYSTGFQCSFMPYYDGEYRKTLQIFTTQEFTVTKPLLQIIKTTHLPQESPKVHQIEDSRYILQVIYHKGIIHGVLIVDITPAYSIQDRSLMNIFTLCVQSTKRFHNYNPPKAEKPIKPSFKDNITKHHPIHVEKKMLQQTLLTGFIDNSMMDNYVMPVLGPNNLRSEKNRQVILLTLLSRTAIEHGLDVDSAYSMSDYYINLVEETDDFKKLFEINEQYVLDYHMRTMKQQSSYPRIVNEMLSYIDRHIYTPIRLKNFASTSDYSYTYLSAIFKETIGESFNEYVAAKKVELACELLLKDQTAIGEISEQLGFSYPYQLTNTFKRVMGMTPGDYRKHMN